MKRLLLCGLCLVMLSTSTCFAGRSRAYAGRQQALTLPVLSQAAASNAQIAQTPPAPQPAVTTSGVSCCPEHGPDGKCTPACLTGKNEPSVASKCPPSTEKCKDIPVEVVPGIATITIDEKFYVKCDDAEAKVPVPLIEIKTTERCDFKKFTYKIDCCEITVCVPCQSCVTESKKCVTRISDRPQKLRICHRRDGTVDVYVLDVPGMPKQWLLYMEAKFDDVKKDLGI